MTRDDVEPELAMWNAALLLFLDDARDYLSRGDDPAGYRRRAYRDLLELGPMLCWLCKFAHLEPAFVRDTWLKTIPRQKQAA